MKMKLETVLITIVAVCTISILSIWAYSEINEGIQESKREKMYEQRLQEYENNESNLLEEIEKIKED